MPSTLLNIFIVEDDPWYGQILMHYLGLNPEYVVSLFETGEDLLKNLYLKPDIVCMDFGLPDITGGELLSKLKQKLPDLPIIVVSAQEDIHVAVALIKDGARDYIVKNDHAKEQLWKAILHIKENLNLKSEVQELKSQLLDKYNFEKTIIGQSKAVKQTFRLLNKAINSQINVSLYGETGTGKEVYAKAIHFNSERKHKPFVAINMSAIPSELLESELFGHEKGSFTGATQTKIGKFEEANGGTLFLDEIAEMDFNLQSKVLRVLQEREIARVGGSKAIKLDFRLIIATHKNLVEEVKNNQFREDLFYRIAGLYIALPPLRSRENDVLLLAKYFIDEYVKKNKLKPIALSEEAKVKLKKHIWPGNVRELKSTIDLACVMCENNQITDADLSFHEISPTAPYELGEKTMDMYEIEIIEHYLQKFKHDVLLCAKALDMSKSKIYNLIKSGKIKNK